MDLETRLNILKNSRQIKEDTYFGLINIIDMFKREFNIFLTEDNGAMLITHTAIAVERVKGCERVSPIDEFVYKEILDSTWFGVSANALRKIEYEIGISFPEEEKGFMMLHLCTLFQNERELEG